MKYKVVKYGFNCEDKDFSVNRTKDFTEGLVKWMNKVGMGNFRVEEDTPERFEDKYPETNYFRIIF